MRLEDLSAVFEGILPLSHSEFIDIFSSFNRVLAEDLKCVKPMPAFDNSAMDGYAFNYDDRNSPLKIKGTIFAGDTASYKIDSGECYKIMTGAPFPINSNTVLQVEDEAFNQNGELLIPSDIKKDNARKLKGEEANIGDILLSAGEAITPASAMMIAAQGSSFIKVKSQPKIAIFSSGDEINEPWQNAPELGIYNANAVGTAILLDKYGFKSSYKGVLKDDKEAIKKAILSHKNYDILVSSGGASKGDADYMKEVLADLGFSELFGSIDIRPAKPTKLFQKDGQYILILPGNPMSCFIGAFLALLPLAKRVAGYKNYMHRSLNATLNGDLKLKAARANIVLGDFDGEHFTPYNNNIFSPSQIKPLLNANSVATIDAGISELNSGSRIKIYKIS